MVSLADVFRRHGPDYLARHGTALLPSHRRALWAIATCRTAEQGGSLADCNECGRRHLLYHSCRHRACPRCGYDETTRWLERQREALLPVPYFHVVFTLPAELRRVVRSHQKILIDVLFRAAFDSLTKLCRAPRALGARVRIGALAVLHTWSRTLEWHPHVHLLVPGGGLAPDGLTWRSVRRPRRKDFLVPKRALAKVFRARFLSLARRALPGTVPAIPWGKAWVVFVKRSFGGGTDQILQYLGRYVRRTALTDKRLVKTDDLSVTFSYRDSQDYRRKTMTLPADEFIRRFLQHVPPRGLHRVRAYGLLHPAHRVTLWRLQLLLGAPREKPASLPAKRPLFCPHCHGELQIFLRLSPAECLAILAPPRARAPPTGVPGESP